jgi:branched-chain amino acid transport system substrate-binding protein
MRSFPGILAFILLCGCAPDPPLVVGAALSNSFVNATRMAIDDAGREGGLPPLDSVLLPESSNRAAVALEAVERFLATPGLIGVVGHSNSSASLAAAPMYNRHAIVQIAPTTTAEIYSQAGPFSFRLVPADNTQGAFLARVTDSLFADGTRLALFYVNDDYGRGLRSAFLAELDTTRFPVVHQQPHSDEEVTSPPPDREERVRATLTTALGTGPDVVVWLGRATTFELYLRVLRELAGPIPVLGSDALASWADRAGGWDGIRFVDFLDLGATAELREFRRRYLDRFGVTAGTSEVLSHDAMHLLLAAIRDGARSGEEVRQWLGSLGAERPAFPGLSGPIAFDANGDIARSYVLVTVTTPPR